MIVASVAVDDVIVESAGDGVVALAAIDGVEAGFTEYGVVAGPALDLVVAFAGIDEVVAAIAEDDVLAARPVGRVGERDDVVIVVRGSERELAAVADDDVVAGIAVVRIAQSGIQIPAYLVDAVGAVATADEKVVARAPDNDIGTIGERCIYGQGETVRGELAFVADDQVVPALGIDRVVAFLAENLIVLVAARDLIIAAAAVDDGLARAGLDDVVAYSSVDLIFDVLVGHAREIDDVVALAAEGDDLAAHRVRLGEPERTHFDVIGIVALRDDKILRLIGVIAFQPEIGELAHIELKRAVGQLICECGHTRERQIEVHQRDVRRDVEFLVDREQEQIDLQKREQLRKNLPGDIEDRQRGERGRAEVSFVQKIFRELI